MLEISPGDERRIALASVTDAITAAEEETCYASGRLVLAHDANGAE
jgi:hypothetical protein